MPPKGSFVHSIYSSILNTGFSSSLHVAIIMSPHVYHGETYCFTTFCPSGCHTFVNATPPTFLDGIGQNLAQSKMMMPRCPWSEDFPVRLFLQELWPFTLRLFHNFFLLTKLLHFSTDLDETWHKARWWWVDVHEVTIFRFVDFCKSYGLLSFTSKCRIIEWWAAMMVGEASVFGYHKQISSLSLSN
jgi:hypothetical protein